MMSHPPIDELAEKFQGNKYKLCCIVSKRAKELEKRIPAQIAEDEKKAITRAAEEVENGVIVSSDDID